MVKVKAKAGAGPVAAVGKVSGKKKKDQKKVLKVISKRNGAAQPAASLKAKKKNRKRKNKNKTPTATTTKEAVAQESVSESKEQLNGENDKNAPSSDTTLDAQKNEGQSSIATDVQEGESITSKPQEPGNKNSEAGKENTESGENGLNAQGKKKKKRKNKRKASEALKGTDATPETEEAGKENAVSGENQSNAQGKKKKKRKNKRKASEALEDAASETVEAKDDGEEGEAGAKKANKRQKVEEKKEDEESVETEDAASKKSKKKKEKKHVLFIGNIPFEATEAELREHFKVVADDIVRVTLMSREKNGKGKGYGFLELGNATAYSTALKLNLSQFKDRKINVEFTTPGKNTNKRKSFMKLKTKKLLGQKKGNKAKKKAGRKH